MEHCLCELTREATDLCSGTGRTDLSMRSVGAVRAAPRGCANGTTNCHLPTGTFRALRRPRRQIRAVSAGVDLCTLVVCVNCELPYGVCGRECAESSESQRVRCASVRHRVVRFVAKGHESDASYPRRWIEADSPLPLNSESVGQRNAVRDIPGIAHLHFWRPHIGATARTRSAPSV